MLRLRSKIANCISNVGRSLHNASANDFMATKTKYFYLVNVKVDCPFSKYASTKIIQDLSLHNWSIEVPKNSLVNEIRENSKQPLYNWRIEVPKSSSDNEIRENFKMPIYHAPAPKDMCEIQAARLIVIRRRKMKKHKLKKLRKKMKFEWAKVRQRREMRKEKIFQSELISQIKQAEQFSAEQHVLSKLREANEILIPRFWKGKRLPQFIIKQKLGLQ